MKTLHNIAMLIVGPPFFGTFLGIIIYLIASSLGVKRSDGNDIDFEALMKIGWIVMFIIMLFYLLSGKTDML